MGFNLKDELKCFFIDNDIHTCSHEIIIKDKAEKELDYLNN